VAYVGKSKNLHKRVRQYFSHHPEWENLNRLVHAIRDIEFRVSQTELDALIMEHALIKEHKPRFNTQLKDDLAPLYLRVSLKPPTFSASTAESGEGAWHFGPFHDEYDIKEAIEALNLAWSTPLCGKGGYGSGKKACLNYHMKRCLGPCEMLVDENLYMQSVEEAIRFLKGEESLALDKFRDEMTSCAEAMEFEKAAQMKSALERLEKLQKRSSAKLGLQKGKRVALAVKPFKASDISLFFFLNGELSHREDMAESAMEAGIERFCQAIQAPSQALPDSPQLAWALLEIYAHKLHQTLPDEASFEADAIAVKELCLSMKDKA
jgi:excinuclease ABC subunit C